MTVTTTTATPRVYVASLTDYNAGVLHGRWIDATDAEDLRLEVAALLADSPTAARDGYGPAEEWAIHDFEGFCGWRLGEWEDFDRVAEVARAITAAGDLEALIAHDDDPVEAVRSYVGCFDSLADWAQEYADDVGALADVPDRWPLTFIDWGRAGAELAADFDVVQTGGRVYIFRPAE